MTPEQKQELKNLNRVVKIIRERIRTDKTEPDRMATRLEIRNLVNWIYREV